MLQLRRPCRYNQNDDTGMNVGVRDQPGPLTCLKWPAAPPWMEASPPGDAPAECPVLLKKEVKVPLLPPKNPLLCWGDALQASKLLHMSTKGVQQHNCNMTYLLSWLGFWPSCHHNHDWYIQISQHHVTIIIVSAFTTIVSSSQTCR